MIRVESFTLKDACEALAKHRPEATERARNIFKGKAEKHLSKDYRGSRGLQMVGLGGNDCDSSVVLWVDEGGVFDTTWCVTVYTGNDAECFDSEEALGYNSFIRHVPHIKAREAEIRNKHIEERRKEKCDESAH